MTDEMRNRQVIASKLQAEAQKQAVPQLVAETMLAAAAQLSGMVKVKGLCPGCESTTLFVGNGGYITCSLATCPDPTAAHRLLDITDVEDLHARERLVQTVDGPVGEVGKPPAQYVGKGGLQPFEIIDAFGLDFYEGNALMYLLRWRWKNGIEDLRKAAHYIQEVIARADGLEQTGD